MASVSRFCVFWIRNTIRNVTMVVPVLITSCQVSLKWKIGPITAQATITAAAAANAHGVPVACDTRCANWRKTSYVGDGALRSAEVVDAVVMVVPLLRFGGYASTQRN